MWFKNVSDGNLMLNFLGKPLLHNIQWIYVIFEHNTCDLVPILLKLITLPQLKTLDLTGDICTNDETTYIRKCSELEKCIKTNSKLQELTIQVIANNSSENKLLEPFIACIMKGIAQNKIIKSFRIIVFKRQTGDPDDHALTDSTILESLLRDNNTLEALSLHIPNGFISSPMNEIKAKSKLTALDIGGSILMNSILPCIKELKCLILPGISYPPCLIFNSYPDLQQLTIQLDTKESIDELFTILKSDATLKALRVEVKRGSVYTICSNTACFRSFSHEKCSASSYISTITAGIMCNTGLRQLSIPVFLPITNKDMRRFLNVISQTDNITELELHFQIDSWTSYDEQKMMKPFFYEQALPEIFNMLGSHASIKTMSIVCNYLNESSDTNTTEIEDLFFCMRFPSLRQLEIKRTGSQCMIKTFTKSVVVYPYRYPITRKIKMYIH
ncbi:PREDICTED: uncharacterized protein LOC109586989 [Amphimedon queenslandica]|uniref:Uncharacterized protein n=1 Tax=Amphimedon queenslandica TaxID=400682 RepID=A0AAN0JPL8_AMPQE|nr:PREDICTED: uncharacterized protein LOC109586989 [Amphimedon queenslandica]|eukprot:XP_019858772.1 PREDICTED: uncharacterized protein LOC109586989 [Amphimedon queenslandica]